MEMLKAAWAWGSEKGKQAAESRMNAAGNAAFRASDAFEGYFTRGMGYSLGQVPWAKSVDNVALYEFIGKPVDAAMIPAPAQHAELVANGIKAMPELSRGMKAWHMALGPGVSLLNAGLGYADGGIGGAFQAVAWDVSTHASVFRHAHQAKINATTPGRLINPSGLSLLPRFLGAGVGSQVGYEMAGYPGMFIGGYIGGSYKGMAAVGGLAAAGTIAYGVAKLYQAGASFRRNQKMLETSGDMSAFMTGGAMTMRSRAVSAIQKSHLNARSALGQEASFLHMPSKNYHSRYRGYY